MSTYFGKVLPNLTFLYQQRWKNCTTLTAANKFRRQFKKIEKKKAWEKCKITNRNIEFQFLNQNFGEKNHLKYFQKLLDTLNLDDSEIKKRLSELTRRITVYRVNEKALTRRYQIMEEMDGQQRKVSRALFVFCTQCEDFLEKLPFCKGQLIVCWTFDPNFKILSKAGLCSLLNMSHVFVSNEVEAKQCPNTKEVIKYIVLSNLPKASSQGTE